MIVFGIIATRDSKYIRRALESILQLDEQLITKIVILCDNYDFHYEYEKVDIIYHKFNYMSDVYLYLYTHIKENFDNNLYFYLLEDDDYINKNEFENMVKKCIRFNLDGCFSFYDNYEYGNKNELFHFYKIRSFIKYFYKYVSFIDIVYFLTITKFIFHFEMGQLFYKIKFIDTENIHAYTSITHNYANFFADWDVFIYTYLKMSNIMIFMHKIYTRIKVDSLYNDYNRIFNLTDEEYNHLMTDYYYLIFKDGLRKYFLGNSILLNKYKRIFLE